MKRIHVFGLMLLLSAFSAAPALALTANHPYTVQLSTVTATGQQTAVEQMDATADGNGKLNFHFNNVPDTDTAPFLMVQIMDTVGGQQEMLRQTLVPAPTPGQKMQMGVNEVSFRQTQAALQAMQSSSGTGDATLRAMFPMTMIPTGAMSDADAADFGQAAGTGCTTFRDYLTQHGVTADQMNAFLGNLMDAMRGFAADNKAAVDQADPGTAAGLRGRAGARLMVAMIQAGAEAGIDPTLIAAAFDQAGRAMDSSSAFAGLPAGEIAAMHATFLAGAQQRHLQSQMRRYAAAMPVVGATSGQTQTFTAAMTTLQNAMIQARQDFCRQAFADPSTLPDQNTINQALGTMETAMRNAFGAFNQATTATSAQVNTMLGTMAGRMGSMMGGGMMSGSSLAQMGFGMIQTNLGGSPVNWTIMMVAASNLVPSVPGMTYTPVTANLTSQLSPSNVPPAPDWSQLPDGPYKSLLELQYDLMLVHLIDLQAMAALTPPLTQEELASISAQDLANRAAVRQGIQGLSDAQIDALMAALSPPHMF